MDRLWYPPPNRAPQRWPSPYISANIVAILTLLLPAGKFRNLVGISSFFLVTHNFRRYSTGDVAEDYLTSVNIFVTALKSIDFILLRNPERSLARSRTDGSLETPAEIESMTLWEKLKWSFSLGFTSRGIGWNWRVRNVDEAPPSVSRWRFVATQLVRLGYCNTFIDFRDWYMKRSSATDPGPMGTHQYPPNAHLHKIVHAWLYMGRTGFGMSLAYSLVAIVAVGSGTSKPVEWPPMFGKASEAYTMRNVWGYCWHQYFRRLFEVYGNAVVSLLRIRQKTLLSRYVRLFTAFFISAVIHHVGALNLPYTPTVRTQFLFFLLQPVAIVVEDAVIAAGRMAGIKTSWKTKTIGFVWVFAVLSATGCYCVEYYFDSRIVFAKTVKLFRLFR